jgi:hypothetical protein
MFKGAIIHGNLAFTRPQKNARGGRLPPARTQLLN